MTNVNMKETTRKTIDLGNFTIEHTYVDGTYHHSYLISNIHDSMIGGNNPTFLGSSPLHIQALIEALKGGITLD